MYDALMKRFTVFMKFVGLLIDAILSYATVIRFGQCLRKAIEIL